MKMPGLLPFLAWCLAAFLAGSIPFGLLLVKLAGKGDVRQQGSGNIGATNVLRSGGKLLGVATLALDVAKGLLPVLLARQAHMPPEALSVLGLAAVAGHMYCPWLRFEGGKGVATALGVILAYHPAMAVPSLGAFLVLVLAFRFVSLGSIVAALALIPASMGLFGSWACLPYLNPELARYGILAWIILALLVVRKHAGNLARLLNGTEHKLWGTSARKEDPHA